MQLVEGQVQQDPDDGASDAVDTAHRACHAVGPLAEQQHHGGNRPVWSSQAEHRGEDGYSQARERDALCGDHWVGVAVPLPLQLGPCPGRSERDRASVGGRIALRLGLRIGGGPAVLRAEHAVHELLALGALGLRGDRSTVDGTRVGQHRPGAVDRPGGSELERFVFGWGLLGSGLQVVGDGSLGVLHRLAFRPVFVDQPPRHADDEPGDRADDGPDQGGGEGDGNLVDHQPAGDEEHQVRAGRGEPQAHRHVDADHADGEEEHQRQVGDERAARVGDDTAKSFGEVHLLVGVAPDAEQAESQGQAGE